MPVSTPKLAPKTTIRHQEETHQQEKVELLVCVSCRRATSLLSDEAPTPNEEERAGALLYQRLVPSASDMLSIIPVQCMQNCNQGCSIALRGHNKWTYIYGNICEITHLEMVIEGAKLYAQTTDGIIPWRIRAEHFKKNCIARVPPVSI